MSFSGVERVVRSFPGRYGEWAYHVVLGLIGTIAVGISTANGLTSTTVGIVATALLAVTTAIAFTAAYLTASALDEQGAEREDLDELEEVEQSPPIDAIADGGSYDEEDDA